MIEKMKAVCIAAQSSHKDELLTDLRDLEFCTSPKRAPPTRGFWRNFPLSSASCRN